MLTVVMVQMVWGVVGAVFLSGLLHLAHRRAGWISETLYEAGILWIALAASALTTLPLLWNSFTSVTFPITNSEVGFEITSLQFARGLAMYPAPNGATVYGLLYGPAAYLPYAALLKVVPSPWAPKALGLLSGLAALALVWRVTKLGELSVRTRAAILAAALIGFAVFLPLLFNPKGDPFLVLCTAVPWLWHSRSRGFIISLAIAGAIAVNIKLTAIVAFLPHLIWAFDMRGAAGAKRSAALGLAIAAFVVAAPFTLSGVSLSGYFDYLELAAKHRLDTNLLLPAVLTVLFWIPLLSAATTSIPKLRIMVLGIALAWILLLPSMLKVGSGPYHALTLVPTVAFLAARARSTASPNAPIPSVTAFFPLLALSLVGIIAWFAAHYASVGAQNARTYSQDWEELQGLLLVESAKAPVSLVGGITTGFRTEDKLFAAMLAGATLYLSPMSVVDLRESGWEPSKEAIDAIRACRIPTFIGMFDQQPWIQVPLYEQFLSRTPSRGNEYGTELASVFATSYEMEANGNYVVWRCKAKP